MGDNCPTANDLGGNYRGGNFFWVGGWVAIVQGAIILGASVVEAIVRGTIIRRNSPVPKIDIYEQ